MLIECDEIVVVVVVVVVVIIVVVAARGPPTGALCLISRRVDALDVHALFLRESHIVQRGMLLHCVGNLM